jgi:hypothetical protein
MYLNVGDVGKLVLLSNGDVLMVIGYNSENGHILLGNGKPYFLNGADLNAGPYIVRFWG